ncbi:MAG: M14 family zinc carboxypeptidase [Bacteroidota bacterium]|nr:M14 family zinc carboxypeptidase [Bacteroidota bacterium]
MTNTFFFDLLGSYSSYKDENFSDRRIKHNEVLKSLKSLKEHAVFHTSEIGVSVENRSINMVTCGTGDYKILLWSQMHGNESTGTQVIFDIFKFLSQKQAFQKEIGKILSACKLYFIPLLNPDGAERFTRENAFGVDINRDAVAMQTPEAKILMNAVDAIQPEFVFNLHDQVPYYGVKETKKTAVFSFLSPAYNQAQEINQRRREGMSWISSVTKILEEIIPGQVGKYSDLYMNTAFGDNVQKRDLSAVLIESGWTNEDPEKQEVRKLHFAFMGYGLLGLAEQNYGNDSIAYEQLSYLSKDFYFDILFKNVTLENDHTNCLVDIGIRRQFLKKSDKFVVDSIGDLSNYSGYTVVDVAGRKYSKKLSLGGEADRLIGHLIH